MEKKYKNKLPLEEQAYFREIKNYSPQPINIFYIHKRKTKKAGKIPALTLKTKRHRPTVIRPGNIPLRLDLDGSPVKIP